MGLNDTPSASRVHIGFFGSRNAGKSSMVNAVTGQDLVIVSGIKGTTTDPVSKAMELLPLGPVLIIDTPGIDDSGELGELRVRKAKQVLNKTDVAVLVSDTAGDLSAGDLELIRIFEAKKVPYIIARNKSDLPGRTGQFEWNRPGAETIWVSAKTGSHQRTQGTHRRPRKDRRSKTPNRRRSYPSRRLCGAGYPHR
jgi:small GTP-binding protein